MSKKIDLSGQRFGRLVVLCEDGRAKNGGVIWKCHCDCGNETHVTGDSLRKGRTTSCGCFNVTCHTKHGVRYAPEYTVWSSMMQRCYSSKCKAYNNYGGRGITVCDEWQNPTTFCQWSRENGYDKGLQLDRIDNDKGYSPENCHYVTRLENVNNRRNTAKICDGTSLTDFCRSVGIITTESGHATPLYQRIRRMWITHRKPHPELIQKANELISLYTKCLKMLKLRDELKLFKSAIV